jgi:hypothetical protein
MDRRARLEELRKEFPEQTAETKRQRLERLRAEFKTTSPEDYVKTLEGQSRPVRPDTMGELVGGAYQKIAAPLAAVSTALDPYVGAPMRAYLSSAVEEKKKEAEPGMPTSFFAGISAKPFKAAARQFGEDPSQAPTWGQIAGKYGVPEEKTVTLPGIKDFGVPGRTRFEQTQYSPAELVGGVVGGALDPTVPVVGAGLKAATMVPEALAKGALKYGVQKPIERFSKYAAGVPEDVIKYYKENYPRLKGQKYEGIAPLRTEMLEEAGKITKKHDDLIKESQAIQSQIKENIQKHKNIIGEARPDLEHIKTIESLLEQDKKVQDFLSDQADEELGKLNIVVPRKEIEKMVRGELKGYLEATKVDAATANEIRDIADRLPTIFTDYINGPQLREWMQKISKLPKWNMPPGAYNSDLDRMVKNIRYKVSEGLKKAGEVDGEPSPYRKIMDQMSARASASDELARYFTTDERGISTLQKLYNVSNEPAAQNIDSIIRNYAKTNEYPQLIEVLDELKRLRGEQRLVKGQGYEAIMPQEFARQRELEPLIESAKKDVESISRMNEPGIENLIRDIGRPHQGKLYNQEQLANLEKLSGKDFSQKARDIGNLREFTLDRTRGSKRTTPGAIGGGIAGGVAGLMFDDPVMRGATIYAGKELGERYGQMMDVEGGVIARRLLDKAMDAENAQKVFFEKMKNPSGKFARYAQGINRMAKVSKIPAQGLIMYHQVLYNNDPEYRKALMEEVE